ncbi:hypothetical protein MYX76_17250 [Desulfobacterota bacterium AH_259_B03_O07]|nr:hypothetical protein [Desulfobacterota bacterium AH_259_B03_O07]
MCLVEVIKVEWRGVDPALLSNNQKDFFSLSLFYPTIPAFTRAFLNLFYHPLLNSKSIKEKLNTKK